MTKIKFELEFKQVLHVVQMLHGAASDRRLNVRDRRERGCDDYDEEQNAKQLAMADEEGHIMKILMEAHVANGGDLEDFARL